MNDSGESGNDAATMAALVLLRDAAGDNGALDAACKGHERPAVWSRDTKERSGRGAGGGLDVKQGETAVLVGVGGVAIGKEEGVKGTGADAGDEEC